MAALLNAFVTLLLFIITIFIAIVIVIKILKKGNKKGLKLTKADKILIQTGPLNDDITISGFSEEHSFYQFLEAVKGIEKYDNIKEIILDIDNIDLSITQIEELEPILDKLRKTKTIKAISSSYTNNEYMLALLADKIYMLDSRNANMLLKDYTKASRYYKPLLDKLGVVFNVLHIGNYKSAGENLSKERMSEENRESLIRIYGSLLDSLVEKIKRKRNVDVKDMLVDGKLIMINYIKAKELGLIDGGSSLHRLDVDTDYDTLEFDDFMKRRKKDKNKSKNVIALISLEGDIAENTNFSLDMVKEKLDIVFDMKNLKGVVLRINSPGGSALESELILREMKYYLDVPVFVSMGDVCASGGYYVSTISRKLYANPSSITGSIGVVSMFPSFEGTFNKIGINVEKINASKGYELEHLGLPLSESIRENIIESMKDVYFEFKSHVRYARILTEERLEPIAGGRIWLGTQAKENGLVDVIGGLNDAIEGLAKHLKLDNYKVVPVYIKESIGQKIKNSIREKVPFILLEGIQKEVSIMCYDERLGNYR